ncbi:hypothetical protein GALL_443860 [mine drainage metagenome]|uniref:Uncharacterized protein n=1 Tax=mine drainage metagenome TaxID=410659 RepID=A0A1J5Q288_9ZZZZ
MVQHIDIKLALFGKTRKCEIAAADKAGDWIVGIFAEQQVQLGMKRIRQKQADLYLTFTQLSGETLQAFFIGRCRQAESNLLSKLCSKLVFDVAGASVVDQVVGTGKLVKNFDFILRGALHPDQHTADLTCVTLPVFKQVVDCPPATQIKVTDAKVRPLGYRQRGAKNFEELLLDVVEYSWHKGVI